MMRALSVPTGLALLVSITLGLSLTSANAGNRSTGETVDVSPSTILTVYTRNGAVVTKTPAGLPFNVGLWSVKPGSHRISKYAVVDGRRYALIPWRNERQREPAVIEKKKDASGCAGEVQHFAAIDTKSNVLNKHSWVTTTSDCDIGNRWEQRIWMTLAEYSYDDFAVYQEQAAVVEVRNAENERRARETEQKRREEIAFRSRLEEPAKRSIGATVCRVQNGMGYAGYTEQVSPDTGKIRIRVVRNFYPRDGKFLINIPPEQNIWDEPANWYLCDF